MSLECIVCGGRAEPFFTKRFEAHGLGVVEYQRCVSCGLVMSKTHFDLSPDAWGALNASYHHEFFGSEHNADDPRWMERLAAQRQVIGRLSSLGALPSARPWVDWGCGDGKLADALTADGLRTEKFDRYISRPDYLSEAEMRPGGFDLVLNTSVMEHVRDRRALDEIASLAAPDGALAVHTLVRGEIPRDPAWFYLLPVHTAFFTNRAMQILCEDWGVTASVYSVSARMWFLFRERNAAWEAARNSADGAELVAQDGFVAYWP